MGILATKQIALTEAEKLTK